MIFSPIPRHRHRTIATSRTYQLAWAPNETNRHDRRNFSRAYLRPLIGEVLHDAVLQATAVDNEIADLQQRPVSRMIGLTGIAVIGRKHQFPMTALGRSGCRGIWVLDAKSRPTLKKAIFLRNDPYMHALIGRPTGWAARLPNGIKPTSVVREAFLRTLSRSPGPDELQATLEFVAQSSSMSEGARGVLWALLNTKEFSTNH